MRRTTALVLSVVWVASVLVAGFPQPASAQQDARSFQIPNRISFTYSAQIAQDAVWQRVPASPDPQTPTGPVPEYMEITFQNYDEASGWTPTGPFINVYPTVTFPEDPSAPYARDLQRLREVLAARPTPPESDLPMLPIVTASQLLRSRVEYLEFENGAGIRYLTAAGLDVSPLSDGVLFYTFQGLTNDGAYYIAAVFPLVSDVLPSTPEPMDAEQYETFVAGYDAYLADITAQLEAAPLQSFAPDLMALDGLFASLTITAPAATFVTPGDAATADVSFETTQFSYDAGLASRVEVDVIPPFIDPGGMSMYGSEPGMTIFSFLDYPVPHPYGRPAVRVIPVDTFPGTDTISDQLLAQLQAFLTQRPPLETQANIAAGEAGKPGIPVLPAINAAQAFVTKPEYLDFANGTGVRFVTYYAQGIDLITNGRVFYAFQGLTSDGRYVVSAEFPLSAPVLPDDVDPSTIDVGALAQNYLTYLNEMTAALGALNADDYTPSLSVLDALIRSVRVSS